MSLSVIRLLRPKQWTKNLLVFAAPLFTANLSASALVPAFWAFLAMCLASSATYVFNDLRDVERDRSHPKKKLRPIAAGDVSPSLAMAIAFVCVAGAIGLSWLAHPAATSVVGAYFGLQALYNFGVKSVPIADVFTIALGFVLRAVLGAVAIQVPVSAWLFFCTGALALMLGFSKRRDEFIRLGDQRTESRESLGGYSRSILDMMVGLSAGMAMIGYGIYAIESPTAQAHPSLGVTTLFVWYGVCRYLYLVLHEGRGEEPETILLTDPHILLSVAAFIVAAAVAVLDVFPMAVGR